MIGYDFDKTIYDGDSFTRFYLYCLSRFCYIALLLPFQATVLLLFGLKIIGRKKVKELFAVYLWLIPNVPRRIEKFWNKHIHRIKPWYFLQKKSDDLIVSASPEFLLLPAMARLNLTSLIATRMDLHTHKIAGNNCYCREKVVRYESEKNTNPTLSAAELNAFYSDSLSDLPMMFKAGKGIFVKKNELRELDLSLYADYAHRE